MKNNSKPSRSSKPVWAFCVGILFGTLGFAWLTDAVQGEELATDFAEWDLEELLSTKMTLVTRKAETIANAPAAISVLTWEDIRRSGLTTIADVLRMIPGVHTGHINAHTWTVSARGFGGRFANKLLVLVDGRSVYTPFFSGVYWEVQDVSLEEVERIEVIRGPGASLWGTNAMNGVINIVTQKARDSQGTRLTVGGGSEERGFSSLRYGGKLGKGAHYRIYGKFSKRDSFVDAMGKGAADDWDIGSSGFRLDWEPTERDAFSLQGGLYQGSLAQHLTILARDAPFTALRVDETEVSGGHFMGSWERVFSRQSEWMLRLYYDRSVRREWNLNEARNTWDVDFQHRFGLGLRQEILWGGGSRLSGDDTDSSFLFSLDPANRTIDYLNVFVQDDITLVEERLRLLVGTKIERNDFSGWEIQPTARMLWNLSKRHALWGAVARAARIPSRSESDMSIIFAAIPPERLPPGSPATYLGILGSRGIESETMYAFEIGWRHHPTKQIFVDLAAFYNVYRDMVLGVTGDAPVLKTTPPPPYLIFPIYLGNNMDGEIYGVELTGNWQVRDRWRLQGSYAFLDMRFEVGPDVDASEGIRREKRHPRHQFSLFSRLDLPGRWTADGSIRYVDEIPDFDVESVLELDVRLGWKPFAKIEISMVGQNLLHSHIGEYLDQTTSVPYSEPQRGVYGSITWEF